MPISFEVGEEAWLDAKNVNLKTKSNKLTERHLGPFKVVEKVGSLSYKLQLPDYLRRIHPVFHVSQLEPATENPIPNRYQPPPPPIKIDEEVEYEVAEVLDSKIDRRFRRNPLRYYVRWTGYEGTDEEFEWISAEDLDPGEAINDFHSKPSNRTKPGPLEQHVATLQALFGYVTAE